MPRETCLRQYSIRLPRQADAWGWACAPPASSVVWQCDATRVGAGERAGLRPESPDTRHREGLALAEAEGTTEAPRLRRGRAVREASRLERTWSIENICYFTITSPAPTGLAPGCVRERLSGASVSLAPTLVASHCLTTEEAGGAHAHPHASA